jgi:hypothetical protein
MDSTKILAGERVAIVRLTASQGFVLMVVPPGAA